MAQRRIVGSQNLSRMCLVCGTENSAGLRGRFYELEDGELAGVFELRPEHQSYPGRLHGGIISAVLDETIGRAITIANPGTWGFTAELNVRFRKPVPLHEEITVIARITRDASRLFEGSGELVLADGTVAAEARGKYVRMSLDQISAGGFDEREWFADTRPSPPHLDL